LDWLPFPARQNDWGIVLQWDVASRYATKSETEAQEIFEAITHPADGILQWIQSYW
jgi:hypothetical protein